MLKITIPPREIWDETKQEFKSIPGGDIVLEHSLVSISKWESKWHIPYMSETPKTPEQIMDYIHCMTLTQNVNPDIYSGIGPKEATQIKEYIEDPMTATTIQDHTPGGKKPIKKQIVTSELIYYWMIEFGIPVEFQKWHINRLMKLIEVCNIKQSSEGGQMSRKDLAKFNSQLNKSRLASGKRK